MARHKRMKMNNNVVDAMHQVSENSSQRNKPGQERNQVCKTMNQHNERQQEKMVKDKRMKTNNDVVDAIHPRCPRARVSATSRGKRGTRCARP